MTLQPALLAYLERQIAAGLAPEQVRSMVRDVLDNWGNEAKLDDVLSYLYERLRTDPALSEVLRGLLARSLADDVPDMPAALDADIRRQLFGAPAHKAPPPEPVNHGRDHPHFGAYAVDPDWATVGPVLSRLVWLAREQELAWAANPHQPEARQRALLWRALARLGHLDFNALTELQNFLDMQPLERDAAAELASLAAKMQRMSDGIQSLLDAARVKEPHA
jgi:hypothetical protein